MIDEDTPGSNQSCIAIPADDHLRIAKHGKPEEALSNGVGGIHVRGYAQHEVRDAP